MMRIPLPRRTAAILLAHAAVFLSVGTAITGQSAAPGRAPNIVFILADDAGMGDLGCYGQKRLKTPHIDQLAVAGLRFTNAYSGSMVCAPSRCTLMTGRHTGHATIRDNWEAYPEGQAPLRRGETTVAAVLQQAGYATGICGKWGLGGPGSGSAPNDMGFDFFFGFNCQRHAHRYYTDYLYRNTERIEIPQSWDHRVYAQDLIAEQSLDFIRRNKGRPFFLYCAWTLPHGPYRADQVPSLDAYEETGWSVAQKVYAAMIERLDADVGRLADILKDLGLERDTLVIFTSDNGAGGGPANDQWFGSPAGMRGTKGTLWEGGIRVPMIARWPGRVPAGRTTDFVTAFWDFLPTVTELSGGRVPAGIDGISIVPTLFGREQSPQDYLYWEQSKGAQLVKAVRMGPWKGYQPEAGKPLQLYDLTSDPKEARDIAAEHPEIAKRIVAIMAEAHVGGETPQPDARVWKKYQEDNRLLDAKFQKPANR